MTNAIEQAARAAFDEAWRGQPNDPPPFSSLDAAQYSRIARAVLESLLPPTPAMVEAMARVVDPSSFARMCGQQDAAKDLRAGKYVGSADEIEKMAADSDRKARKIETELFDVATRSFTAAILCALGRAE